MLWEVFTIHDGDTIRVARSQIYNRLNQLNLQTQKRGNKAYVNAEQIAQLDQIHQLIMGQK